MEEFRLDDLVSMVDEYGRCFFWNRRHNTTHWSMLPAPLWRFSAMLMQVRSWMPSTLVDCGCIFAVFSRRFSESVQLDVSPSGLQVAWCCRLFGARVSDTGAGGAGTIQVGPALCTINP